MSNPVVPIPNNESERVLELSSLDLDYSILEEKFKDLTKLAAKLTGKPIALINLIDSYTQWTISNYGFPVKSMDRKESVCQYTIADNNDFFEVKSLSTDSRFSDFSYVSGADGLRYYLGVKLRGEDGNPLGALCVLDTQTSELDAEKVEILKIIAAEIVNRLYDLKMTRQIINNVTEAQEETKTLATSIREPLAGIVGILQVIIEDAPNSRLNDEVLQYIQLIQRSSNLILGLTDAVLDTDDEKILNDSQGDLIWLKSSVEALYQPICKQKGIDLKISISERTQHIPFFKNKLLQIVGNLISNAINDADAVITLDLSVKVNVASNYLIITLTYLSATNNTNYYKKPIWLLIKRLVESLDGTIETGISRSAEKKFEIKLPV
jgi:GAF domain-containing protein